MAQSGADRVTAHRGENDLGQVPESLLGFDLDDDAEVAGIEFVERLEQ